MQLPNCIKDGRGSNNLSLWWFIMARQILAAYSALTKTSAPSTVVTHRSNIPATHRSSSCFTSLRFTVSIVCLCFGEGLLELTSYIDAKSSRVYDHSLPHSRLTTGDVEGG
ncbi:unnamed protein product [Spirodela intermedia]|uniref:Uncharacterized protein n=1 Tax=Spirodela intermedia TaxID=51605 RepID=A0ABN7ECS1_SPIIN|nr:unnamed protein product [Spirodela intermedia]